MKPSSVKKGVSLEAPGTYRIKVQGLLDDSWSERLGGMEIRHDTQEGRAPVTTLFGCLPDQAALLGVQIALYDLHLPLLSVERVEDEDCVPTEQFSRFSQGRSEWAAE